MRTKSRFEDSGARAVEVAAMLGDSVVGVKHCVDPRGGAVTRTTWALLATGIAGVVTAGVAFASAVDTAATNKAALAYHTDVLKKPAYAFRPAPIPTGTGALALGGFALGLAGVIVGATRLHRERRSPFYRVGTAPGVELPLESAPAPCFPLVAPSGDAFVFNAGAGIEGALSVDGMSVSFDELVAAGKARPSLTTAGALEIPIPPRARIHARSGGTTFVVSAVEPPRAQAGAGLAMFEARTLAYVVGSLAVHLGIWGALQTIPPDSEGVSVDLAATEAISVRGAMTDREDMPPEDAPGLDEGSGGSEGAGATMALAEGAAGNPDAERADGHLRIKDTGRPPALTRAQAIEQARHAGILGSQTMLSSIGALASNADYASGFDDANVYGQLFGSDGEGKGVFGGGISGFGQGGGCTGDCGVIGTGRYATIGTGRRVGDGWSGPGDGKGPRRDRVASAPEPVLGQATSSPGIDKAIIRRYIKRNLSKIAYCYERELLARPGLGGTIQVQFLIAANGSVQGATGSGFDQVVASCVTSVVQNISFPAPKDGGSVQVNYPFTFHAAGQGQ